MHSFIVGNSYFPFLKVISFVSTSSQSVIPSSSVSVVLPSVNGAASFIIFQPVNVIAGYSVRVSGFGSSGSSSPFSPPSPPEGTGISPPSPPSVTVGSEPIKCSYTFFTISPSQIHLLPPVFSTNVGYSLVSS